MPDMCLELIKAVLIHWTVHTEEKKGKLPPRKGGRRHVTRGSGQSGVSAHCDPVQRDCFIEGLVVINERVELSTVLKVTS